MVVRFDGTEYHLVPGTQFIHEWVHHLEAQSYEIVDMSRGKPSYPAHHAALLAMKKALSTDDATTITYGTHALGEAIYKQQAADFLSSEYSTSIGYDQITFTPGGQLGLYITLQLFHSYKPKGKFVCTIPGYLNYHELIKLVTHSTGVDAILPIILSKEDGYQLTPELLKQTLANYDGEIAGFIFCHPLNPTGQVISNTEWATIANIIAPYDAPILLDEAFKEILFTDRDSSLYQENSPVLDRIFLFRSGTKALGMSGERLALTVIPQNYVKDFLFLQSRILANPPISGQAGMAAGLCSLTTEVKKTISDYYQQNAQTLMAMLNHTLPGSIIAAPQGGFYLLANLSQFMGQPISPAACKAMQLTHQTIASDVDIAASLLFGHNEMNHTGIAFIPGSFFGLPSQDGVVRISFSVDQETIEKCDDYLKEICKA